MYKREQLQFRTFCHENISSIYPPKPNILGVPAQNWLKFEEVDTPLCIGGDRLFDGIVWPACLEMDEGREKALDAARPAIQLPAIAPPIAPTIPPPMAPGT